MTKQINLKQNLPKSGKKNCYMLKLRQKKRETIVLKYFDLNQKKYNKRIRQ